MDPLAARRTQAGAPVVHGIHSLLWLLNEIAKNDPELPKIAKIKCTFTSMIYVGDTVAARIGRRDEKAIRGEVVVNGAVAVEATMTFGTEIDKDAQEASGPTLRPREPIDLELGAMAAKEGFVEFASPPGEVASLFPALSAVIGADRVAAVVCSTCLVGMVLPGLHSIYRGITFACVNDRSPANSIGFRVTFVSEGARFVRMDVAGGGISGQVDSMVRHPPIKQPTVTRISEHVSPGEFSHINALVIGGSRGLGELAAKIISAGGGRVTVTYSVGSDDAERVAREIRDWGGTASTLKLDVLGDIDAQLGDHAPSHIYYFATPPIFRGKHAGFSAEKFDKFIRFYVTAFSELIEAASERRPDNATLFYPSSVAVENRPPDMTEYAMAKAAGEILCKDLETQSTRIIVERLPRLATDQTAALIAVKTENALDILLPIVRRTAGQ
jgi:hypothetical protein